MNSELGKLVKMVYDVYDVDISKYDEVFLNQTIGRRFVPTKTNNISEYAFYLDNNPDEAAILFNSLNNTHTEFFRNSLTFAHLEQWILPRLFESKPNNSEVRIWSAGCSSGQEAYSIAMLTEKNHTRESRKLRYRIIATDVSDSALLHAAKGEYREEDIQKIRVKELKEFFIQKGDAYTICDRLKHHVGFSIYDLLDEKSSYPHQSIFGNFDLVTCCNLLFYYTPERQQAIVRKLINSLDKDGFLIVGEAEKQIIESFSEMYQVVPPSPIFKQRKGVR